ncbi:MAG: thioredoxin family protein [Ignavibacteriales bacterium]|nr:thioredoxin family protein [Ignavibacteriales bacterium]
MNKNYLNFLFALIIMWFTTGFQIQKDNPIKPKVTFIELGSVNCIPCKKMQPIMKSIEEKYGSQVKVIFHDVWKDDQKHYAKEFGIKLIPTQIFLDQNGKEIFRHEGFYPEKEIDTLLQSKGLALVKKKK